MHGLNRYALHLSRLEHSFDEHALYGSLTPFSEAISRIEAMIRQAEVENDQEYQHFFLDSDLELVETHLGCAFVTCQVFLTAVVSRVQALHGHHYSRAPTPLTTTSGERPAILAFGSTAVGTSGLSQMQVIDAFANYFKHRDQWRRPWSKLGRLAKETAVTITAVGAHEGSTGNLRTGAEVTGNPSYTDVESYSSLIIHWRDELWRAYRAELIGRGLLKGAITE